VVGYTEVILQRVREVIEANRRGTWTINVLTVQVDRWENTCPVSRLIKHVLQMASRHIMFLGGGSIMATHFDEYEKQARQLEQIAKTLSKRSARYAALKRAAWALGFVTMQHHSEFQKFLKDQQARELSSSEQKYLSRLSLE